MKKWVAIVCLLGLITTSLCSCGVYEQMQSEAYFSNNALASTYSETENTQNQSDQAESSSSQKVTSSAVDDTKHFDDFVSKLENSEQKPNVTSKEDGAVEIEIQGPNDDNDKMKEEVAVPSSEKVISSISSSKKVQSSQDNNKQYTYTTGQKHKSVPSDQRYYYSILDSTRKQWYLKINDAVEKLQEKVIIDAPLTQQDSYIYLMYMLDHPEHFYLGDTVILYSGEKQSTIYLSYAVGDKETDHTDGEKVHINNYIIETIKQEKKIFEANVAKIISTIPADAPDVVKEKLIYDRILIDGKYDMDVVHGNNPIWSDLNAYGMIVNKKGVCEAYAEAFQMLCLEVGINCTDVVGEVKGGYHEWNCVKLDGEWYMCDVTFDDPTNGKDGVAGYHDYFNVTAAYMKQNGRDWTRNYGPVPTCSATKYSYQNYFGK